ncbi:phage recombination protein Bet [Pyxidicoccus parkwayensis]|uniref:Phage recombination protein Bet n=1 Tax=Pyxidicoccus parkwayensis TaxID=2813578 RepID=A0ABX7NKC1_9BACT|nr:phage recombination protein Bet [Pyxidicoccus parkwaysis]QSQ19289.1 phage recombination protein Bet [Pyxidicoccus parkwaysis]
MADGNVHNNSGWTPERIELVKRTICPKGISNDEFALFIEQCRRSGLDPLLKEAFCVARRLNIGNRERPQWVTKHEFQPSEAGMLARAERFPDFQGLQASAVFAEDEISLDQGKGEVVHRFNPAKRKGALVGAWARVVRDGKLPVVVWLDFSGYVQTTPLWAKIPATMIEKCARVAALRKAYPEAFGGLYVREELPADEAGEVPEAPAQTPAAALPAKTATREALELAQPAATKAPEAAPTLKRVEEATPAAQVATAKSRPSGVVAFGQYKGKTPSELSDQELSETIDMANVKLMEQPKARWAEAMRQNLALLEAEVEFRCRVPAQTPAEPKVREPGQEG